MPRFLLAILSFLAITSTAFAACANVRPDVSTKLRGTLIHIGSPAAASAVAQEQSKPAYILALDNPICATGRQVTELQIVSDPETPQSPLVAKNIVRLRYQHVAVKIASLDGAASKTTTRLLATITSIAYDEVDPQTQNSRY